MDSINALMENNNDILFEILLRVDPTCIFKCIVVSKQWLEVITSPLFRKSYMKIWDSELVGFLVYDYGCVDNAPRFCPLPAAVQLLPTSELGRVINRTNFMRGLGYFIAKSNNGGLILSGIHPKRYFVCNPITKQLVRLPPPPMYYGRDVVIAILSPEEESLSNTNTNTGERMRCFRVIQAKVDYESESGSVPIQTFSSSTGRWEQSMLACSVSFNLERHEVKVIGDVVYWAAMSGGFRSIAAYDTSKKNQDNIGGRISLSKIPEFFFEQGTLPGSDDDGREMLYDLYECYGESPKGFLLYAACSRTVVNIWVLDYQTNFDDASSSSSSSDHQHQHHHGWSFWQRVDLNSMWVWLMKNSGALGFKSNRPKIRQFVFISFVPGRSNSVFVRLNKQLFIYHLDCKELERIHYYRDRVSAAYRFPKGNRLLDVCFQTLTMTELGAWPCSPSSSIFHEKKE